MTYDFATLDVFTDETFGGNPLAVLPDRTHGDIGPRLPRAAKLIGRAVQQSGFRWVTGRCLILSVFSYLSSLSELAVFGSLECEGLNNRYAYTIIYVTINGLGNLLSRLQFGAYCVLI